MLSFFAKKYFLADFIQEAFDIHNHFLPDIDDGAADLEMSKEMLRLYKELGFNGMINTPHIMQGYYNNNSINIKEKLEETQTLLQEELKGFPIRAAAEYMVDSNFSELIKKNELLLLDKKHLLLEMSYAFPSFNFDQTVFELQTKGIKPIFAHPERYNYLKTAKDYDFARKSCRFQLNALSLGTHYGKAVQQKAFRLLDEKAYYFIGTDAHRPEHLSKLKEITLPKKYVDTVKTLWEHNEELR